MAVSIETISLPRSQDTFSRPRNEATKMAGGQKSFVTSHLFELAFESRTYLIRDLKNNELPSTSISGLVL